MHSGDDVGNDDRGRLDGRVALVTGAATGLGLGIARSLAQLGARVVLNDLDDARLQAAGAELADVAGDAVAVAADVSRAEDVERLVRSAEAVTGRLDVLVNNAGVQIAKDFVDYTIEDWDRLMGVNLRGVFLCMHAAVPGMIAARSGVIVNMASVAAFHTTTPHIAYGAAKAGVAALTRDAAHELAGHGIRVNAVAPGPIATPMTRAMDQGLRDAITRTLPVGRWGAPSDVGDAVAFLAGDRASFITGITLPVAGGSDLQVAYGAAGA